MGRKKVPSPYEILAELEKQGEIDQLINGVNHANLVEADLNTTAMESIKSLLLRESQEGANDIIGLAYRQMLALATYLMIRSQAMVYLQLRLADGDQTSQGRFPSSSEVEASLEKLQRLHQHIMTLSKSYATIQHTLGLKDKMDAETQHILKFRDYQPDPALEGTGTQEVENVA